MLVKFTLLAHSNGAASYKPKVKSVERGVIPHWPQWIL